MELLRSFWLNRFCSTVPKTIVPPSNGRFFSKPFQFCFLAAMWAVACVCKRNDVPRSFGRSISTASVLYQETRAEYPPILSMKPEAKTLRTELHHHKKIRNLNTVEEKAIGINMPRLDSFLHKVQSRIGVNWQKKFIWHLDTLTTSNTGLIVIYQTNNYPPVQISPSHILLNKYCHHWRFSQLSDIL